MQIIQGLNAINFPFIWAMKTSLRKFKIFDLILKNYPFFFFIVSLMIAMKQNSKPVDEVNAFINQIVKMSYEPIAVIEYRISLIKLISYKQPPFYTDSCWWGGFKLPESFQRPCPDCHWGKRGAEEEGHHQQLARWRRRGVVTSLWRWCFSR